tara:strand:+ start:14054 stop:15067 length:1014 start_codon:yes stop_codon:yes gene_type:complete
MEFRNIEELAEYIVSKGKGILAADESNPTCAKRFDSIGVESNETNRRDYREMLFRSEGMKGNIGGVILFDETIRQKSDDGTSLVDLILQQDAIPGIKVDQGLEPIENSPEESVTKGLQDLGERCKEYRSIGARFTKWRAVIRIGDEMPSENCINTNMENLAKYAKIAQDNDLVPIVEPEVLMEGSHNLEMCYEVTDKCLRILFKELDDKEVNIKGSLLKPNMVTPGSECKEKASVELVAKSTLDCLMENVPEDLPGVTFLSGGQSDINSTAHLDAMNKIGGFPWKLSFSYGRALQQSSLKAWLGIKENIPAAQFALSHRASMNRKAALGEWSSKLEN